jgi:hypothetical protein
MPTATLSVAPDTDASSCEIICYCFAKADALADHSWFERLVQSSVLMVPPNRTKSHVFV